MKRKQFTYPKYMKDVGKRTSCLKGLLRKERPQRGAGFELELEGERNVHRS